MSNQRDRNALEYDGNNAIPIEGDILSGVLLYDRGRLSFPWTPPMSILDDTAFGVHISCLYLMLTSLNEVNQSTQDLSFYLRFCSFLGDSV
jgi:hypothetical protein